MDGREGEETLEEVKGESTEWMPSEVEVANEEATLTLSRIVTYCHSVRPQVFQPTTSRD